MRQHAKLAGAVLAAFIVFLLILFPARVGFALFAPPGFGGFGFEGTLWNGSVQMIRSPTLQLRNTHWDLEVSRLLLGQLAARIESDWSGGFVEGLATIGLGGAVTVTDARATMAVAALQSALRTPPVDGQIELLISELQLRDSWPEQLVASAEIRNLSSQMVAAGADGNLGSFAVNFDSATETEVDTLTGKIADTAGPLEVSGTILLTPPLQYSLKVRVKPRDSASAALRRSLDFLGPPQADGSREFQLAGSL